VFEPVEAALKTAMITGGKYGVIAFKAHITALATARSIDGHRDFFRHRSACKFASLQIRPFLRKTSGPRRLETN